MFVPPLTVDSKVLNLDALLSLFTPSRYSHFQSSFPYPRNLLCLNLLSLTVFKKQFSFTTIHCHYNRFIAWIKRIQNLEFWIDPKRVILLVIADSFSYFRIWKYIIEFCEIFVHDSYKKISWTLLCFELHCINFILML